MSHAIFERALVTVSIGSGAHRVALSIYHLTGGTKWCWIDERADLESLLWRLELSFRKTGGVPRSLGVRASRPFTKPNSRDWSATFQRFCTHFGVQAIQAECGRGNADTEVIERLQSRTFESLQSCQQALHDDFPPCLTAEKLQPLPLTAFVSDKAFFRRVAGDGFMLCRGDAYSVPDEYRGKTVWIEIRGDQAIIRSKEGRLLAQHPAGSGKGDVFLGHPDEACAAGGRVQTCLSSVLHTAGCFCVEWGAAVSRIRTSPPPQGEVLRLSVSAPHRTIVLRAVQGSLRRPPAA